MSSYNGKKYALNDCSRHIRPMEKMVRGYVRISEAEQIAAKMYEPRGPKPERPAPTIRRFSWQ